MTAHPAPTKRSIQRRQQPFGAPPLFPGEDAAGYDELLERLSVAIKPKDFVEEMWVRDCADLTWETARMRRIKAALLTSAMLRQLKNKFEPDELLHDWAARDPDAVKEVDRLLALDGHTIDDLAAQVLSIEIERFERIDRMIMNAEARRNAALRELERHRATLAQALRQASESFVEAEFEDVKPARRQLRDQA
jgi:hypothetical protein